MRETEVLRTEVQVDGEPASYLTAERDGPPVVLLHGTYWSRVWLPVLDRLAAAGLRPLAVDFPGMGRSGGELTHETATVPALADWVTRFVSALRISGPVAVAGHDIGGAVAQHLLAHDRLAVSRLALVNSVLYDSWPAPHVARLLDQEPAADEDDRFEKVEYAEKFASEIPRSTLIRIPEARHIPTENAPGRIGDALVDFFTA